MCIRQDFIKNKKNLSKAQYYSETFRIFAIKMAKLLRLDKKRNEFLCFVLDFSYLCKRICEVRQHLSN